LLAAALIPAGSPALAASADLSESAREVAEARKTLDAAQDRADDTGAAASAAQQALQSARSANDSAAGAARKARTTAELTAKQARRATVREGDTAQAAAATRATMVRIARNAYMNGADNAELAAFVGFATIGPAALNALASHNMAVERIQSGIVADVERTGAAAARAAEEAGAARDAFQRASDAEKDARKKWKQAKAAVADASAAAGKAGRQDGAAQAALARAQDRFDAAKTAFEDDLAASGGSAGAVARAPSASPGNQAQLVWDLLIAEGFSPEATAGILGNLQQESNIDPTTIQNGGPGRGLAQWSAGGRWDNGPNSLLAYAGARGLNPWNAVTQTRFMIYEMELGWGGFSIDKYKKMTDVLAATVYFHDEFEGSADSSSFVTAVRGGYAMHWYKTLLT
jgi:hypothetical protein